MPPQRRTALAALCCGSAAALAGLPTLDLYLDLRMTAVSYTHLTLPTKA